MVVIARKQRQAIRSARTLIDFNNLGPDTEVLDLAVAKDQPLSEVEEEIVFDNNVRSNVNQRKTFQSSSKLSSMVERQKNRQKRNLAGENEDIEGRDGAYRVTSE